jgi:hypothetical protein
VSSERVFQSQINAVAAALQASVDLGLGRTVYHGGMTVLDRMPEAAQLGAATVHLAICELRVSVNAETCGVVPVTEEMISSALLALTNSAVPDGLVWDRVRISENDAEFKEFYRDRSVEAAINAWFVRRILIDPHQAGGIDTSLVSTDYTYELRYVRGHDN